MRLWKTIDIADNERALLHQRGKLQRVLGPGRHRVSNVRGQTRVEKYDISEVVFQHPKARWLLNTYADLLASILERVETSDSEVGLVYYGKLLVDILAPGSLLVTWKGVEDIRVDVINVEQSVQLDAQLLRVLRRGLKPELRKTAIEAIHYADVADEHIGLLLVNGTLVELLKPGTYGYWRYGRDVKVKLLDMRLQAMEVNGQEILTKDRVSLRINLSASYRIAEPRTVALQLNDATAFIYRELQLRLREAVGTQLLDELLADKDALNSELEASTREQLANYGIALLNVGVKDIILPGEMKSLLNRVVEAQKEAEANLIRRREETQAMRSLHNTAKVMENNPTLLRLKELEALESISQKVDSISVYSGLDGVMNDLVRLAPGR